MAADYDSGIRIEQYLLRDTRARLCGQARGRTLEVAIGTGRNLGLYPAQVELTGLDLSGGMLRVAAARAAGVEHTVALVQGDAQRLPFDDATFDTIVCTLSLCAVPDQTAVVAEMHRVLVPGGLLLLVDHIEYARVPLRWIERISTRRHLPRRRPLDLVVERGFRVDRHERLALGFVDRIAARKTA
jgi:ubiquinone/menaquinone biosynthesis C-methylase UbiE